MRGKAAILVILLAMFCTEADAQWRRRWRRSVPRATPQRTVPQRTTSQRSFPYSSTQLPPRLPYPGPPWQRATDDYYRAAYPKYYGGFHAREFQNLGFPSGDIGLRGNGLYMGPW